MDSLLFLRLIDHVTRTRKKRKRLTRPKRAINAGLFLTGPHNGERERPQLRHIPDIRSPMNYILQLNEFTR